MCTATTTRLRCVMPGSEKSMPALFGRGRNAVSAGEPGSPPHPGSLDGWTVEQVVRQRMIAVKYRPVVRLDSGEVVGFRAVPCAPPDSCFATTDALWRAAREIGLTAELDQVAHAASYRDMLAARTHPSVSLLVRADPRELDLDAPPDLADVVATALSRVRVFVETSAETVLAAPDRALAGIAKARACGWGVAWDQLGDSPTAFTLIPFVQPDLVTVDVHLLDAPHAAAVLDPLRAYTERSGASLMVTGIESDAQLHGALAAGATLGQGRYHGELGPIPPTTPAPRHPIPILRAPGPSAHTTPYEILTDARPPVHTTVQVLDQIADHLAQRCCVDPEPPAILITAPTLSEPLHKRLTDLAGKAGL